MLLAMVKKTGSAPLTAEQEQAFLEHAKGLSGADMEALLARARLNNGDLQGAMEDFLSPSYPEEIELQTIAAVLECTSRGLLPEAYRTAGRGELFPRVWGRFSGGLRCETLCLGGVLPPPPTTQNL